VGQYYKTPLGAAKPHKGGWWLKVLELIESTYVHFAATPDVKDVEEEMLRSFAAGISDASRRQLSGTEPAMPFANLRDGDWQRRNHGIRNATIAVGKQQRVPPGSPRRVSRPERAPVPVPVPSRSASVADHRSQRITDNDVANGQIRIPRPTKAILPAAREDLTVLLRGRKLTCRWDPRYGPPERSGVIRIGKAAAAELLTVDEILAVTVNATAAIQFD
jgi:hypothetical protein